MFSKILLFCCFCVIHWPGAAGDIWSIVAIYTLSYIRTSIPSTMKQLLNGCPHLSVVLFYYFIRLVITSRLYASYEGEDNDSNI